MLSDDVRAITENLTEAMRFFGRSRDNGSVRELAGATLIYCGLDYAAFNAGVMSQPVSGDSAALDQSINGPADYFEAQNLRWSYWYCDDYVGKQLARRARVLFDRQESHAHAVFSGGRQGEAQPGALALEEFVGHLDQDAGPVAGFRVAAAGPAVGEIDQDLNALDDNVVGLMALDVGDEPDTTGVVLEARIVETLRGW